MHLTTFNLQNISARMAESQELELYDNPCYAANVARPVRYVNMQAGDGNKSKRSGYIQIANDKTTRLESSPKVISSANNLGSRISRKQCLLIVICFASVIAISLFALVFGLTGAFKPSNTETSIEFLVVQNVTTSIISLNPVCEPGPGEWQRVVYLNMSDPLQQCPPAWREYTTPVRSCGRPETSNGSCPSVLFSANGFAYSRVYGRAVGYQYGTPDAFSLNDTLPIIPVISSLDDIYVDGISITHGNPRVHIWTFAAGHSDQINDSFACPCANPNADPSPWFISSSYFCESGRTSSLPIFDTFYPNDPLWDGKECVNSQCCTFNSPPWFLVELPSSTTDDIEVRICGDESTYNEDVPIEFIEMYVQ